METADWEYAIHLVYGWYMYYFWIVVIAVGITTRLWSLVWKLYYNTRTYRHLPGFPGGTLKSWGIATLPQAWLRRYLTIPATFGTHCSQPYVGCTIPPRVQSLTIALFVVLNLVLCSCSYRFTEGNLYWPKKSAQFLRFVSDRTGIISLANFPLMWLFGMRNDVLIWMTGWGFGTYNAFHRWVARVATLQAVVHSLGYTLMILSGEGWSSFLVYWTKHYFWNGEIATIAMCALLAFSFYGIRRAHYEMFLVIHIALSIATLWTMYYHVEIFKNGEWNIFIWPCVAIWVFDRVVRMGRILAFSRFPLNTKALVTYDSKSNLIRMEVDGTNNLVAPKPGTYYYIHVLDDVLYAHQNHPFTLAHVLEDVDGSSIMPLSPITDRSTPLSPSSDAGGELDELLASKTPNASSTLVFFIRPYDGFTSRIKSHCLLHPTKLRVLIEGPYGHTVPLQNFTNILFMVGGTGIAVPLSHLASILSSSSHVQSVKIVWAVREYAALVAAFRDFRVLLSDERLELEVHVTREEAKDDVLDEDMKSVRIMSHRPNVHTTIEETAQEAGQQRLAIVACGPALMADQARKASVEMLGRGHCGVEYFEESFKW
ncbi:ferric reductase like transmembrane component [Pyrenophora tritici-repentis]|nr:ferric reductase like transmembrane component [Pyrenophora tritici-repentis]KAI1507875.1 ferric reductase transmembrane component [Pyrenophora tritici-repentis]KAI1684298.1 ferric reductase transmembrane component [Pyrenophora tritici-repentis]PZC90423.1 ferric reductase [Pyrenophora tritici-repentis]PZD24222.1 ferric reductase [Pyrenophora tritici-repentis]